MPHAPPSPAHGSNNHNYNGGGGSEGAMSADAADSPSSSPAAVSDRLRDVPAEWAQVPMGTVGPSGSSAATDGSERADYSGWTPLPPSAARSKAAAEAITRSARDAAASVGGEPHWAGPGPAVLAVGPSNAWLRADTDADSDASSSVGGLAMGGVADLPGVYARELAARPSQHPLFTHTLIPRAVTNH
jgi:hypothetical protein